VPGTLARSKALFGITGFLEMTLVWVSLAVGAVLAFLFGALMGAPGMQWRRRGKSKERDRTAVTAAFDGNVAQASPAREAVAQAQDEVHALARSMSGLRRCERLLRLSVAIDQALCDSIDEAQALERFCRTLVHVGGYCFVWLGFESAGELHRVAKFSSSGFEDFDPFLLWSLSGAADRTEYTLQAMLQTAQWQVTRRNSGALDTPPGEGKGPLLLAATAIPLRVNDQTVGILLVCADHDEAFGRKERAVLAQVGEDLARHLARLHARPSSTSERIH
jgi:hypothetical protein